MPIRSSPAGFESQEPFTASALLERVEAVVRVAGAGTTDRGLVPTRPESRA